MLRLTLNTNAPLARPYTGRVGEPPAQVVQVPGIEHERALGDLRVVVTAEIGWLLEGLIRAHSRFQAAEDAHGEAKETFIPLFEALNWAASFELFMRDVRKQPLKDDLVHAFGYARNRVHHQWAAALEPVETPFSAIRAAGGPQILGTYGRWHWKPLDHLPEPDRRYPDPDGETAYPDKLAGQPVRPALSDLQAIFEHYV